ncbi:zf-HC2 domain-containing protein [Asanoa sp. NPDC049573]|uniref:zf-HC2 domain-containing protein n=1 Tax=Asanoa sp. NPDC049573 TaxID=3155396 RepID=UPI0034474BB2
MSREQHWDVASYALGVLDEADTERFEAHLAECWVCAGELESFLPAVDALAEVNGADLAVTERIDRDGALLRRTLTAVGDDRRRVRQRRLLSIAAGIVLIALIGGFALFAGARWVADPQVVAAPTATAGVGPGEPFSATDPATGVHADLAVDSRPFGTRISFALSKLEGPATCHLVVLADDGRSEVVSSWRVPPEGYGTAERPTPLMLQTATSMAVDDMKAVQVQVVHANGATSPLVTVPM